MSHPISRQPVIIFVLWLVLLLAILPAGAQRPPRVITIVDAGVGWATVQPASLPPGAAVAGMSDPATGHGWSGALLTLSACGRNVGLAEFTRPTAISLVPAVGGRWQLPPALWQALGVADHAAHAGTQAGRLGTALRTSCRVVLVATPQRVAQVALVAADGQGSVDAWLSPATALTDPRIADAAVFVAPEAGQGISLLNTLAQRFPATPLLYFSALPSQTPSGKVIPDLTPVVLLGAGPGLLTSRRTHWHGVVSALDYAPTLLRLAGISPAARLALDDPLTVTPHTNPDVHVRGIAARARAAYPAVIWLDVVWFITMGLLLGLPVFGIAARSAYLRGVLLACWLVPVLLIFVLPQLWFLPLGILIGLMMAGWLLLAIPLSRLPALPGLGWAAWIGSVGLFLNAFGSITLASQPFLGYHLVMGYRYYGMGNESTGVFLIILTMLVGWLLSRAASHHWLIICGCYSLATIALGFTWWGADWGGAMTAILTALLFILVHYRARLRWWHLPVALVTAILLGAALIALLALLYPVMSDHSGAFGREIMREGWPAVQTMIARKLAQSWRMWQISLGWISAPAGILFGIGIACFRTYLAARRTAAVIPSSLWDAVFVAWWCAVIAGLINDNGIGQTGLMWITLAPAVGVLVLHWRTTLAHSDQAPQCSQCNPD